MDAFQNADHRHVRGSLAQQVFGAFSAQGEIIARFLRGVSISLRQLVISRGPPTVNSTKQVETTESWNIPETHVRPPRFEQLKILDNKSADNRFSVLVGEVVCSLFFAVLLLR